MSFLEVMASRGLIAQVTHEAEFKAHLQEKKRSAYCGYDPTADSLTVGHLMPTLALRRWQQDGNRAVVLMGGGTGLIGDPTGKTSMRKVLTPEDIEINIAKQKAQLSKLIDFSDSEKGVVVNNADWLLPLEYLPFLRDIGRYFSVNRMLTADCFRSRLENEQGLTFLEFNYMLLQAYDFLHLHKAEGVSVQLGGDDQWSNMLAGSDLVRRVVSEKAFCLTVPLLTTADGRKMGKTESGAVWLDPDKTSVFDFFQYWRNCDDASVKKCLYFLTDLPVEEVERLAGLEGSAINEAKIVLATEVTRLIHGDEEAERAKATTANLYGAGNQGGAGNEPEILLDAKDYLEDMNILELLVVCRIVPSKSEGRRLIQQGGLAVDGEKIEDIDYKVTRKSLEQGLGSLFKKGKKHFYRVRLSSKV